jgi:hypothetical protein
MKSIALRTLVREPLKVKRWTRAGQSIQITDRGEPLWILQPAGAATTEKDEERRRATDAVLEEVLRARPSRISAARLLEESRR